MTSPRILIVEDEIALAEIVRDYLLADGMAVDHLPDGGEAVAQICSGSYDLVILDLMLPKVDGLTICREVRASNTTPIIMTTAKVEEIDRLLGLELGADDYLCKPYSPRELVARTRAVLRRSQTPQTPQEASASDKGLFVDHDRWRVTLDGQNLDLTRREFKILATLHAHPGRVYSRDQLLALAFPDDADVYDRTVDSHIRNIRRKCEAVSDWNPVRSVYGVGYAFED
jgi:two-component system response regulator BaeR